VHQPNSSWEGSGYSSDSSLSRDQIGAVAGAILGGFQTFGTTFSRPQGLHTINARGTSELLPLGRGAERVFPYRNVAKGIGIIGIGVTAVDLISELIYLWNNENYTEAERLSESILGVINAAGHVGVGYISGRIARKVAPLAGKAKYPAGILIAMAGAYFGGQIIDVATERLREPVYQFSHNVIDFMGQIRARR